MDHVAGLQSGSVEVDSVWISRVRRVLQPVNQPVRVSQPVDQQGEAGKLKKDLLVSYGHITLDIPDPIRTLKSSRVEPT